MNEKPLQDVQADYTESVRIARFTLTESLTELSHEQQRVVMGNVDELILRIGYLHMITLMVQKAKDVERSNPSLTERAQTQAVLEFIGLLKIDDEKP